MHVSLKATYGILAALDIALHNGTMPVRSKSIAKRQAIPARFLEQVLNTMKRAGFVESARGAQGGYTLRKSPADLSLAEIVQALDGSLVGPGGPVAPRVQGRSRPAPLLGEIWDRVRHAELQILSSVTLKDLVERQQQLQAERALMFHI